jgi:hypothetical protein
MHGHHISPVPITPFIPFAVIGSLTLALDSSITDPGQPTNVVHNFD